VSGVRGIARWLGRLALVLQLGMAGLPVLDAALFHDEPSHQQVHIEAAGADCHHAECGLGQSLLTLASSRGDAAAIAWFLPEVAAPARDRHLPRAHDVVGIPLGPRAPPRQA
jgi:hypothetical protein